MARDDDRYWVSTVCCTNCPRGLRIAKLFCKLTVCASLTEWDAEECLPNLLLKASASHVERHRKGIPPAHEIFVQFLLSSNQYRVFRTFEHFRETNTAWIVVVPKNSH